MNYLYIKSTDPITEYLPSNAVSLCVMNTFRRQFPYGHHVYLTWDYIWQNVIYGISKHSHD